MLVPVQLQWTIVAKTLQLRHLPVELTSGATHVGCSSGASVEHISGNVQRRSYKKQRRIWTQMLNSDPTGQGF